MSLQRAYVNCMRCHGLVQPYIKVSNLLDKDCIKRDDHIYKARNETMGALEEALVHEEIDSVLANGINEILAICADCDFKKAYVAKWAKPQYTKDSEQD
jgi:hypothetical protein